ncbi:MAG: PD-(D/E)XK nuclease family protein [Spirochaetaceae bacterium]|nr:PD-(D/E)XK nuclease family protein [Spirochaetaceae bacterium]
MNKPNIFKLATGELTQDAFLSWLLQWSENKYAEVDLELYNVGQKFVQFLLDKGDDYIINTVKVERQWSKSKADIVATINNDYFILIEDKTSSGTWKKQLEKHKEFATKHCEKCSLKPVLVYLKTGNESKYTLNWITQQGCRPVVRDEVLAIIKKYNGTNVVLRDFIDYLEWLEKRTVRYTERKYLLSDYVACQGLYLKLQEDIKEASKWKCIYKGKTWCFGYHFKKLVVGKIYIQIENSFAGGISLMIKLEEFDKNKNVLEQVFAGIQKYAQQNGLALIKLARFNPADISTVGKIENAFKFDEQDKLDYAGLLATLEKLERTLDDYTLSKQ